MTSIPETIAIHGNIYRVVASSEPPTPEELSDYVRAIANAKRRIATLEESMADLQQKRDALQARLDDAERELRLARTMLTIRSEGYGLTADDQEGSKPERHLGAGLGLTVEQAAAGLAKVDPGPGAEYFAVMRDDWTTGEVGLGIAAAAGIPEGKLSTRLKEAAAGIVGGGCIGSVRNRGEG